LEVKLKHLVGVSEVTELAICHDAGSMRDLSEERDTLLKAAYVELDHWVRDLYIVLLICLLLQFILLSLEALQFIS
jgi:hypothetical protein